MSSCLFFFFLVGVGGLVCFLVWLSLNIILCEDLEVDISILLIYLLKA